jgi:hypothetical protein
MPVGNLQHTSVFGYLAFEICGEGREFESTMMERQETIQIVRFEKDRSERSQGVDFFWKNFTTAKYSKRPT